MNIKFRVWDEKYKEWQKSPILIYPGEPVNTQGRVIQMFTGLLDKNGKEIYEGDIISEEFNDPRGYFYSFYCGKSVLKERKMRFAYKSVVSWCSKTHCFIVDRGINMAHNQFRSLTKVGSNVELLGNIFDNLDLAESILKS